MSKGHFAAGHVISGNISPKQVQSIPQEIWPIVESMVHETTFYLRLLGEDHRPLCRRCRLEKALGRLDDLVSEWDDRGEAEQRCAAELRKIIGTQR